MIRRMLVAAVFLIPVSTCGCGGGGLDRHDLHGKVTYKGEPVPAGTVSFRPDRSKGGTGPSGFARIVDGEYSTSGSGKGSVLGPVQVMIAGAVDKKPMSAALFPIYKTTIDVSGDSSELDFEVPETSQNRKSNSRR